MMTAPVRTPRLSNWYLTDEKLEFHPLTEQVPPMSDEQFRRLKADLSANGQLNPVLIYQAKILDGRARYTACRQLGIPVIGQRYTGERPELVVRARNYLRRHLSDEELEHGN